MQTLRLRTLVDPRQAQILLDSYVARTAALPAAANKQPDPARLPQVFGDRIDHAESEGAVWSAWTSGPDAWLFVAQLNLHRSRERGQPVLEIESYDYERRTRNRLVALRKPDGAWQTLKE